MTVVTHNKDRFVIKRTSKNTRIGVNSYLSYLEYCKNSYVHYFNIESDKNQELLDGYKEYRFKEY